MMISVIIPTYNEEKVILDCLNSLSKQTIKDFEVIVVDDGSYDETLLKVEKVIPSLNYPVRIKKGKHGGAGMARNIGALNANGEILVFVDSDMTFDRNFLKMLTKPILLKTAKGTNSVDEYVANWNNIWSKCWNINQGWENKKRRPKKYEDKQRVFRAILKSEFDKVNGFTAGGYNDDWSLSDKLGYKADIAPKAIFFHKNPDNLNEVFNHAKWVGKRKYKFGILGFIIALIRCSLPVSIIVGLIKALYYFKPAFFIFKLVYDFGNFIGIIIFWTTKKGAK